jgi:serine protease AprX
LESIANFLANKYFRTLLKRCQAPFHLCAVSFAFVLLGNHSVGATAEIGARLAAERPTLTSIERIPVWVYVSEDVRTNGTADLSARCVGRRLKTGVTPLYDRADRPPSRRVVERILATGARLRTVSRYLGAVSVDASRDELDRLERLPFVQRIERVAWGRRPQPPGPAPLPPARPALEYGASAPFLNQVQITELHALGFTGRGVLIGMLDTGYCRGHVALDSVDVIAEWDFIHDDGCTENEDGQDALDQHNHGTRTLSVIAAWDPGRMVGGAYAASFLLAKTEELPTETEVEEDYWVEGLEWAEGLGADVVSSSLGYIDWYDYSDLDGQTAVTTRAARVAARKGVVLCNSMGNSGFQGAGSLVAPADADSILAVGAVNLGGGRASSSSMGPTYDGRIKPDVMACGVNVAAVSPGTDSSYAPASGTSLAAPLVASAVACLIQAHPEWTPGEVMAAIRGTASRAAIPDNEYGWGIVQALAAHLPGDTALAVAGHVQDSWSGQGIRDAWVGWRAQGGSVWTGPVFTDSEGGFALYLLPGFYEVLVQALGYEQTTVAGMPVPAAGGWVLDLDPAAIAVGPNPCSGVLNVASRLKMPGVVLLELWDMSGRRVGRTTCAGQPGGLRTSWDLAREGIAPGRMILRWRAGEASGGVPILYLGEQR